VISSLYLQFKSVLPEIGLREPTSVGHHLLSVLHHTIPHHTTPHHSIPYHTIPYFKLCKWGYALKK